MIRKTIILLSFALCVFGDEVATSRQHIKINHNEHHGDYGELTHIGSKKPEHHEEYAWSYPSYEFSYSVHDPHTHDKKGQEESRKGDEVKGEYWLIEPDGRKRTVTYHADKHSGFHANVHYSDDHHHIVEKHDYGKEERKEEEQKGDDGGSGEEKGQEEEKKQDENEDGNEEGAGEDESSEEGGGAEETRGREEGIVRWGYGPKWDDGGRRRQESHDKRGRRYNVDSMTVYENLGSYGHRVNNKHDVARRSEDKGRDGEESLLWEERRKFDERRGYPSNITPYFGHPSRMNPRFYRHNPNRQS